MLERPVRSLGRKDPLEEEMATVSGILAWETPWTEEPGGLQSMGSQRAGHDLATEHTPIGNLNTSCVCVGGTFCYIVYVDIHMHTLMFLSYVPEENVME